MLMVHWPREGSSHLTSRRRRQSPPSWIVSLTTSTCFWSLTKLHQTSIVRSTITNTIVDATFLSHPKVYNTYNIPLIPRLKTWDLQHLQHGARLSFNLMCAAYWQSDAYFLHLQGRESRGCWESSPSISTMLIRRLQMNTHPTFVYQPLGSPRNKTVPILLSVWRLICQVLQMQQSTLGI